MLSPFKNFFHYSKSERKGTLLLLILLGVLLVFYGIINLWPSIKIQKHTPYSQEFKDFNEALSIISNESSIEADSLFIFDPNTIGVKEWQLLGFSEKQASSIEKYKSKGFVFNCKVDLKKLFVVDDEKYLELRSYIDLPDCQPKSSSTFTYKNNYSFSKEKDSACVVIFLVDTVKPMYKPFQNMNNIHYRKIEGVYNYYQIGFVSEDEAKLVMDLEKFPKAKVQQIKDCNKLYPVTVYSDKNQPLTKETIVIELNSADSIQLVKIDGVWPALAGRIIKRRNYLGGYITVEQLKEVYGLNDEVFMKISPQIIIDPTNISKININKATIEDLKSHPYIDYKVANSIYMIRQNHGFYKNIEDIKKSDLINDELFSKIAPYLKTE